MSATSESGRIKPERAAALLSAWFTTRSSTDVDFTETWRTPAEITDTYSIAYEAVFLPMSVDRACAEVWVTTEGDIAIGFERVQRIAARLGFSDRRDRFVAGHEPERIGETGLLAILELIADGRIALAANGIHLLRLFPARAIVDRGGLEFLMSRQYEPLHWLKVVEDMTQLSDILRFKPW